MIQAIRESLENIPSLPEHIRHQAVISYTIAFRATFASLIGVAVLALVSWAVGLAGTRKAEEDQSEESIP